MMEYLSTLGNQIVDGTGKAFQIRGVNWSGFETPRFCPDGLHVRNYQDVIDQMSGLGFNTLRIPFSNALLDPGRTPLAGSLDTWNANKDLVDLTSLQILDKIIAYAGTVGMRVILDHHRSNAGYSAQENGLWYTLDMPETRWISDWVMLAQRYAGNATVIGADLHNEPFGGTWGGGSSIDWAAAAERAGAAIQAANSDWLIFVEGVQTYQGEYYWWGGNLMGVRDRPVQLPVGNKLVYSAHEYPKSVYPQPWFDAANYPNNLPELFDKFWGFIYRQGIAPVYIGEMGSRLTDGSDIQWFEKLRAYLAGDFDANGTLDIPPGDVGISWSWWALNPNSADTGGILNDDWTTVDRGKFQHVLPLLPGGVLPPLGPSGTPGDDYLNGTPEVDILHGLGGNDTLVGGAGPDVLDGGPGADVLVGGPGNDYYFVDDARDVVVEQSGEGFDVVGTTTSYSLGAGEIERLEAADPNGTAALTLTGNAGANTIVGNAGPNVLIGGAGADVLEGRGGDDTYYVDDPGDQVVEIPGGGWDRVFAAVDYALSGGSEVEILIANPTSVTTLLRLIGNEFSNTLIGHAGPNRLDGGGGADTLRGGGGNDTYVVDSSRDVVVERKGGGFDRVWALVNYALSKYAEVEVLSGALAPAGQAITLKGSAFANTISGNASGNRLWGLGGNDVLRGQGGDDVLMGGPGHDRLYGGPGRDVFVFNSAPSAATNRDRIGDFVVGVDRIAIENAVFKGIGAAGRLRSDAFELGPAATEASHRVIYNSATGVLSFDPDGSGASAATSFAQVAKGLALTHRDILIV